jgi:hypothetical protein
MLINYNQIGKNKIVYCVLDNLKECDNLIAKDMSINTIDFLIRGMVVRNYDVLISDNETELLTNAVRANKYTHAVVVTTGTYLWMGDRLFDEVENICQQDFFIAGHVLDRGDFYLELHKQFYIIDLTEYADLGSPLVEEGAWFVDDYHEEFKPVVLAYKDNGDEVIQSMSISTEKKQYKSKLHGWNILKLALEHNKKTIDVGENIRRSKNYLYHEYDHVFINSYTKIFHQQLFARNVVAPWNSDKVYDFIDFEGPVEQYITLGTGLNWIRNLTLVGYTADTRVVFTDINHNCLRFMKEMINTWDGVDYNKFYHSFEQFYPNGVPEQVFKNLSAEQEFNEFKKFFDNWASTWNSIKQLTFDYRLIDYTADYDLSWIDSSKHTLINFSDMFNYAALTPMQSVKFKIGAENRLIDNLSKINPDITVMFSSRAAAGYKEFDKDRDFISKVKDLTLTDIQELKTLPWHTHDWKTVGKRPLGL